jgi:hypothetical protein
MKESAECSSGSFANPSASRVGEKRKTLLSQAHEQDDLFNNLCFYCLVVLDQASFAGTCVGDDPKLFLGLVGSQRFSFSISDNSRLIAGVLEVTERIDLAICSEEVLFFAG